MNKQYIISVNNGSDFIRKTGFGNTFSYSDKKGATRFKHRWLAQEYVDILPKNIENVKIIVI